MNMVAVQYLKGEIIQLILSRKGGVVYLVSATPPKRLNGFSTIFIHAHLQVVYYKCAKFHKNPISGLGGVALTRYMDGRTDGQGDSYILSRKGGVVYLVSATPPKRLNGFL
jgi:hypothetical protein